MSFTINIYYTGENESAKKFAKEMVEKGLVERVRAEKGNQKRIKQRLTIADRRQCLFKIIQIQRGW